MQALKWNQTELRVSKKGIKKLKERLWKDGNYETQHSPQLNMLHILMQLSFDYLNCVIRSSSSENWAVSCLCLILENVQKENTTGKTWVVVEFRLVGSFVKTTSFCKCYFLCGHTRLMYLFSFRYNKISHSLSINKKIIIFEN